MSNVSKMVLILQELERFRGGSPEADAFIDALGDLMKHSIAQEATGIMFVAESIKDCANPINMLPRMLQTMQDAASETVFLAGKAIIAVNRMKAAHKDVFGE